MRLKKTESKQAKALIFGLLLLYLSACQPEEKRQFTLMDASHTGIDFVNRTAENDSFNILTNEYIYNGGGVGIGDFNRDGKADIFFSGNAVANRLYLNKGDWQFEDVSEAAGIAGENRWSGGVTVVDVNGDGWEDIYVCASVKDQAQQRTNQLYIHQGLNEHGQPVFKDMAEEYGLASDDYNTQAAWLDYDLDGDLDLFLLVNRMADNKRPNDFSRKVMDGSGSRTDKLYRQDRTDDGQIRFVEVGVESGIRLQGFALAATVCDLNRDGRPDIYISNDYLSNDLVYLNTLGEDGQPFFVDIAPALLKQTSYSAMGNDVVDINNDGWPDIVALDMLPADNYRRKLMLQANNYTYLINLERYGYQPQFVRNSLQISQGLRPDSMPDLPLYAETAMLAGIAATDWSWTPLVADFDLDGRRDIIVTNGFPKDITDHDFIDYNASTSRFFPVEKILEKIPSVKLKNQAFRSISTADGFPRFENVSAEWGITLNSFSNGAAYVDLDGDGDLDYVVNNIDDPAHLYRNNTLSGVATQEANSLCLYAAADLTSEDYFGSEIIVFTGAERQYLYWHPHRGYLSSSTTRWHLGLGDYEAADSIWVRWPRQPNYEKWGRLAAGQSLALQPGGGQGLGLPAPDGGDKAAESPPLLRAHGAIFVHEERDFIDFNVQPLLLKKLSQQGPAMAVTDFNQDGLEDVFVSGSLEKPNFQLLAGNQGVWQPAIPFLSPLTDTAEILGSLFFDADGDGDDDLYLVSGSYEWPLQKGYYRDRFFENKAGIYVERPEAIADLPIFSGSCVRAADYDGDGLLDIFVGGRLVPHQYPQPQASYLLKNKSRPGGAIRFVIDEQATAAIASATNVCDALFTDVDNDGRPDLLLAGEWSPLRLYRNTPTQWEEVTATMGLDASYGWWNSLAAGDFDNDGDTDYIAGNYGLNSLLQPSPAWPLRALLADLDANGGLDFLPLTYLEDKDGSQQLFPYHNRSDVAKQINRVKSDFTTHAAFAATLPTYFNQMAATNNQPVSALQVNSFQSIYLENQGEKGLVAHPLPMAAQAFPIFGILPMDLNEDAYLDLLIIGNDHGVETGQGHADAGNGLVLLGQGNATFRSLTAQESGFYVPGEGRSLVVVRTAQGPLLLAAQQRGALLAFEPRRALDAKSYSSLDYQAFLDSRSGRKTECYLGSGYLGQSGRYVYVPQ